MIIKHKIDEFLFLIFPEIKGGGNSLIINKLTEYYTYNSVSPTIKIENNWVTIELDFEKIISQQNQFNQAVNFCEKGEFGEAKKILFNLVKSNPSNSEYHRILGQIFSEEGKQDEAIDSLIDALKWNPKNSWALLMMGNIFSKYKNDISTALKYYDQALIVNPEDHITINNIGANLMQTGKVEEAKLYFDQALKINSNYPNTHLALSYLYQNQGELLKAFQASIKAIKCSAKNDEIYQKGISKSIEISREISVSNIGQEIISNYKAKLELDGDRKIDVQINNSIPTAAKLELAENYNRVNHVVFYNDEFPAVEHLIMHELVHLDLILQARKSDTNKLFISTQDHKNQFRKSIRETLLNLEKRGIKPEAIENFSTGLFEGINSQVFNAPIDLFIEDFLMNDFPQLNPFQFLSLLKLNQDGLNAVTDKQAVEISPKSILSSSKILNLVNSFQIKELFGIDFLSEYKASNSEIKIASDFFDEFKEYRKDRKPGEEYELVQNWSNDLGLNQNFELVDELKYRSKDDFADSILKSIENDPFGLEDDVDFKKKEMDKFISSQEAIGVNMAVVMFMVDALKFFEEMTTEEIKKIGFEIALQGTQGYNPDESNYRISSIKGKTFSGYHILAYYYVSWALAIPEMLSQLQLPYENEYKLALTMHKPI